LPVTLSLGSLPHRLELLHSFLRGIHLNHDAFPLEVPDTFALVFPDAPPQTLCIMAEIKGEFQPLRLCVAVFQGHKRTVATHEGAKGEPGTPEFLSPYLALLHKVGYHSPITVTHAWVRQQLQVTQEDRGQGAVRLLE
jgi:hypothetical protein